MKNGGSFHIAMLVITRGYFTRKHAEFTYLTTENGDFMVYSRHVLGYIYISYLGLQLRWHGYHGNFTPMFVGRWGRYNYCDIYPLVNWLIPIEILGNLNLNIALLTLNSRVSNSQINYIDDSIISKWFICSRWYIYIRKIPLAIGFSLPLQIATWHPRLLPSPSSSPLWITRLWTKAEWRNLSRGDFSGHWN